MDFCLVFIRLSFGGKRKKRKGQSLGDALCILRISQNVSLLNFDIDGESSITKFACLCSQRIIKRSLLF